MKRGALSIVAALAIPAPSTAAVLTAANEARLCTTLHDGRRAVDRDALARAVVDEANIDLEYLDGASPGGIKDGAVQMRSSGRGVSETLYAVRNAGVRGPTTSNRPFGPRVDLAADKQALAAHDAIVAVVAGELAFLVAQTTKDAGDGLTYRLVARQSVGTARTADASNPLNLFTDEPTMVILCERPPVAAAAANASAPASGGKQISPGVTTSLRLRGRVEDLYVSSKNRDAFAATKPARISLERDGIADSDNFALNAVVGLRIGDEGGRFEALPFLSYENRSTSGDNDVEKLSPGILAVYRVERGDFSVHARLEASFIDDLEQNSHQGKLRLYVDPAFGLRPGGGALFGSNLRTGTRLSIRPDLTLIADASKVYRAGRSEELAGADDYVGLGGELSLAAFLDSGQPISDIMFQAGYRNLFMSGEIQEERIARWYASIEYAPASFPFFGIGLRYTEGENDDTFQEEEVFGVAATFRF